MSQMMSHFLLNLANRSTHASPAPQAQPYLRPVFMPPAPSLPATGLQMWPNAPSTEPMAASTSPPSESNHPLSPEMPNLPFSEMPTHPASASSVGIVAMPEPPKMTLPPIQVGALGQSNLRPIPPNQTDLDDLGHVLPSRSADLASNSPQGNRPVVSPPPPQTEPTRIHPKEKQIADVQALPTFPPIPTPDVPPSRASFEPAPPNLPDVSPLSPPAPPLASVAQAEKSSALQPPAPTPLIIARPVAEPPRQISSELLPKAEMPASALSPEAPPPIVMNPIEPPSNQRPPAARFQNTQAPSVKVNIGMIELRVNSPEPPMPKSRVRRPQAQGFDGYAQRRTYSGWED